jgi:hypothetical protein
MCLTNVCPSGPQSGCRTSLKSKLLIKNKGDSDKDKFIWKFIKGQATSTQDFEDPTSTAAYALCIYSGPTDALVFTMAVPPNSSKWSTLGTKGYKYLDPTWVADGAQKIRLKSGLADKTKVLIKGRGINLDDPIEVTGLALPVTAQLLNYETGICWETSYSQALKNSSALFKAKQ